MRCPVLLLLVALRVLLTDSIAPCDDQFLAGLASNPECYKDGKPPDIMGKEAPPPDAVGTTVAMTKEDLSADIKCLTGSQDEKNSYINVFWNNGSSTTCPFKQEMKDGWISQTDSKGGKFKMFVVHEENCVFSYYKCIDGATGGTGTHLVNVAVDCKQVKNPDTMAVVKKAKTCFKKLGVNVVDVPPCDV